jgi:hypothetical protein
MAGGALSKINELLDTNLGMQKQAYEEGRSANLEGQGALSKPRRDLSGLAFAAGILAPTRSGSFGEGLSNGLKGYTDAASAYDDGELDRSTKLAALKAANARLMSQHGTNIFDLQMKRFEAPTVATQYEDDVDRLQNGSGIPKFTPGSPEIPAAPPPPAPPPTSSTTPPPAPNPNATVGSAGSNVLMGGSGQDTLQPGRPPAYPPGQDPAQPGMPQFQQPQIPQAQTDLYNWALQVQQAYARDPDRWARRKENVQALQQAGKIIDDYQRMTQGRGMSPADTLRLEMEVRRFNKDMSQPTGLQKAQQEADLKRLQEIDKSAAGAIDIRQSNEKLRAARERLIFGEDWSTGGIMGNAVVPLLDKVIDTGKGAVDEATGALRGKIIEDQNSGAISNFEVKMFDQQVAGTGMGKDTAEWVMGVSDAIAARKQEQAKFYRRYMNEYGTLQGADEQWGRFVAENPIIDRRPDTGQPWLYADRAGKWQPYLRPPEDLMRSGAVKTPNIDSAPALPQVKSAEDYANIPAGGRYIDPNGNIRTKPRQ